MAFISMRTAPPSRRQLRHWEHVCHYPDAQPYWAVSLPSPAGPPMSVCMFKRMALFQLMRYRGDYRCQRSPRWRAILQRLWDRLPPDEPASKVSEPDQSDHVPCIVDTGVDTLYANLKASNGLPAPLAAHCGSLKARAQAEDQLRDTSPPRWFDDPWECLDHLQGLWAISAGLAP